MKKQFISIALLLAGAAGTLTSCENWLDVTSGSEIRAEDHFKNTEGFRQALIGCYIGMTDQTLYGKDMSWLVPELLGQQFEPYSIGAAATSREYYLQNYKYGVTSAKSFIDASWAKAYNVIVNANEALYYIDKNREVLNDTDYSVIKGELLAIRAYIHLDLARMFGYGNWAARKAEIDARNAVPYVTTVSKNTTAQVSMADFFTLLLQDLDEAARLLKAEDPIAGAHKWSYYANMNEDGFYDWRNLHLNYYAVRALQARAYLWEGSAESKELARAAAEEVIEGFLAMDGKIGNYNHFAWMTSSDVPTYPALALEQIFALNVATLRDLTATFFIENYTDNDNMPLYIIPDDVQTIYEGITSDWRSQNNLLQQTGSSAAKAGYTSKKYNQPSTSTYYSNRVPLIRLPEMYYIAAECYATGSTPNLDLAMERLNTVREKRGIYTPLAGLDAAQIMEEIAKEYRKEFLAEGVMFYFYKRLGYETVPHQTEPMNDEKYVVPYPDFETQMGRVQ